ncbi:acyl-CoA thioesterase II [uncultured Gordonia sp.]|uniref:acyl-CoA thioesterase n=1 Tax=uncultured Gordonia sp. TaxID=198437 RepID=UPI002589DC86|nr:thioesterase family protein [uncultured Gordonia sp.]
MPTELREATHYDFLGCVKQLGRQALVDEFSAKPIGEGTWSADIDRSWWGWSGPHGGVIAALAVHVAAAAVPDRSVRALDLRFVGRPADGELVLTPHEKKIGGSTRIVDVGITQGDHDVAAATVTLGRVGSASPQDIVDVSADVVARPEDCEPFMIPPEIVPMGGHLDLRPTDGALPLTGSEDAWMRAWISTRTPMSMDFAYLALLADCLPPGVFPTLSAPLAVPTVAFSMHAAAALDDPSPAPVLVHTRNVSTSGGWSVDDTTLRDESGRLLATARQSRRVLGWPAR